MKSLSALIAFGLLASTWYAGAADHSLYVYEIEVANAKSNDSSYIPAKIAKFIQSSHLKKECVDLRELGSATAGNLMEHGEEGLVLNRPLSPVEIAKISGAICSESPTNCRAKFGVKITPYSQLHLFAFARNDNENRDKVKFVPLAKAGSLPQFSQSCATGDYNQAWSDTASTKEAQSYINNLGLGLSDIDDMGLTDRPGFNGGTSLWSFGFTSAHAGATARPGDSIR